MRPPVRFGSEADIAVQQPISAMGQKADIQAFNEAAPFRISNEHSSAGQNHPDFGELAQLRINVD